MTRTIISILILSISLNIFSNSWGFNNLDELFKSSNNISLRQHLIDSIVDKNLKNTHLSWENLKKVDFSNQAKEKLVSLISSVDTITLKKEASIITKEQCSDSDFLESINRKCKLNNLSADSLINEEIRIRTEWNLKYLIKEHKYNLNKQIPKLIGWLEIKDGINSLESIINDSSSYTSEFIYNCKLSLARLGNLKYSNEIQTILSSKKFSEIGIEGYRYVIWDYFYLHNRQVINLLINSLKVDEVYESSFPPEITKISYEHKKTFILFYLYNAINDYPKIKTSEINLDGRIIPLKHYYLAVDEFFKTPTEDLLLWLKNNPNYKLKDDYFFSY